MATGERELRGNHPEQYKEIASPDNPVPKTDRERVIVWKQRLDRAAEVLRLDDRAAAAAEGNEYLGNAKEVKDGKGKSYMPYLFPLLEDLFRRTLPSMPAPRVEERNEAVEGFSDRVRELLNWATHAPHVGLVKAAKDVQWDEARYGVGFFKTVWRIKYDLAEPARVTDPAQLQPDIEHAMEENLDPTAARIADGDIHYLHARIHTDALAEIVEPDRAETLQGHIKAHEAEMVAVRREYPLIQRVSPLRYTYDTDVPWPDRAWEAELRSVRIKDLLAWGYKNINPQNLPVERKPGEKYLNYEDMTAQVVDIHDRLNGKRYVIPHNKQPDGEFLFKGDWPYPKVDIYVPVVFHPWEAEQLDGAPLVSLCIPTLERLATVDFHIDRHIREHADYKLLYPDGTLDDKKISQLSDPNKRAIGLPPEAVLGIKEKKPPPLPDALLQRWERLMEHLRRIIGSDSQDQGAPHPHQMTAQESARRGQSSDNRTDDRQDVMADAVAQLCRNIAALYRHFATKNQMVRTLGVEGVLYLEVDPSDIPEDLDLFVDLRGESDDAKSMAFERASHWWDKAVASGYPADVVNFMEYFARLGGIQRPEQFRSDMLEVAGQMPGEPSLPTENTRPFPQGGAVQNPQAMGQNA